LFAFRQNEEKILLVGGRKNDWHQRQPFASFDAVGNNTDILVIDPETEEIAFGKRPIIHEEDFG
jgi:hypothetical protein